MSWIEEAVMSVPQLSRGVVWCTVCGRSERTDSSGAMRDGWPKCCGYTMTIDSPEERAAFEARKVRGEYQI